MPVGVTIKTRRGTAAEWSAANPTLAAGEPGYETDTGILKYGDGHRVQYATCKSSNFTKNDTLGDYRIAASDSSRK